MKVFLAGAPHILAQAAVTRIIERLASLGHEGILVVDGRHVDQADLLVAFVNNLSARTIGSIQDAVDEGKPVLCAAFKGTDVSASYLIAAERAEELQLTYFSDAEDLFSKILSYLGSATAARQPLHA